MMSDFEKNARRELVAVCNAMVSGDVDLIDGSRLLVALRRDLGAVEDELFFPIIAVDSETDHLPRGDMRNYCSKDFLERSDKEASEYLKDCSDNVIEACLQLLDKFKEVKAE